MFFISTLLYNMLYPYIVTVIGIIDPSNPRNKPSIINGNFIFMLDAPTNLIISISFLREKIVILIVLLTKNTVTNIKATSIPIKNLSTISRTDSSCSTIPSPYFTRFTLFIFFLRLICWKIIK